MENDSGRKVEGKELGLLVSSAIERLDKDERFDFNKELLDHLYSRSWCGNHDIDCVNPNVLQARVKLYVEKYGLPSDES